MDLVVDAFSDKRAQAISEAAASGDTNGVIKVTGPTKKEFFNPTESRTI
jgi:hypothetical protein